MTATNHSANQGRVPAQGVPAQQMPTTAPAAPVQGAPVPAAGQTAHVQAAQAPAQQGQVLQAPHGQVPAQQGQVLQAPHGQVPAQQRASRRRVQAKQTFFSVFRSEWSKLASLRSTWITAAIASLITIGISVLIMAQYVGTKGYADKAANYLTVGSSFGQIAVAVLGALLITGEYSSGQIRSSLAAVPRRGRLFAAKALVVAIFSALLGLVTVTLTYLLSLPILGDKAGSLSNPEYLGFFWGTAMAFAIIGLMAMSFGYILRSTAGSISLVVVLLFVLLIPLGLAASKWEWVQYITDVLPSSSAAAVADPYHLLGAITKLDHGVVIASGYAWAIIPMIIAFFVFSKRDA